MARYAEAMSTLDFIRSALFLPAANARAVEKARGLDCDLVILDLEDSVADDAKDAARAAAIAAAEGWDGPRLSVRINGLDSAWYDADVAALRGAPLDAIVVPKVEQADRIADLAARTGLPVLAMIETPLGLYEARAIAAVQGVAGLIAGSNDLAAALRLPPGDTRAGLALALQTIVLAARAAEVIALDGVYNALDDADGFAADCAAGRALGFDGRTLIHPGQIAPANAAFGASDQQVEEAAALIAAFTGGAERFRGRMIEGMHVAAARAVLARAR